MTETRAPTSSLVKRASTNKTGGLILFVALVAALSTFAVAAVAVAGSRDNQHPQVLPARLVGVPELSSVVWDTQANGFIQFMFDRGKIMSTSSATSSGTITIRQGSAGHTWRTQSFAIPATATIRLNLATKAAASATAVNSPDTWKQVPLSRLQNGMNVRIVQTGPVGGTLQIVRVDATRADRDVPLPTAAG
jgi:hypothetical protein